MNVTSQPEGGNPGAAAVWRWEELPVDHPMPRIDRRRDLFEFSATFEDVPTE